MINIKSDVEIEKLKMAGKITALAMEAAKSIIAPGVSTADLDTIIFRTIKAHVLPESLRISGICLHFRKRPGYTRYTD